MAKPDERTKARIMRGGGWSIKQIAHEVNVSTSTASLWCKDIQLSSDQIKELERRANDPHYGKRLVNSLRQRKDKEVRVEKIRYDAKWLVGQLSDRERLLVGVGLYWAEGFKKDKMVGFSNSDPLMVKLFIKWLVEDMRVSSENIRLRVGINEVAMDRTDEIEQYWSHVTTVPRERFYKAYYQKVTWKKKYDHPELYYGTLRVRVLKSTDLLRKILGMIEGLKSDVGV
jgi:hypothetical protein